MSQNGTKLRNASKTATSIAKMLINDVMLKKDDKRRENASKLCDFSNKATYVAKMLKDYAICNKKTRKF